MEIFSFGERLMIYRKRAGLSKKELAKRVGISVSTLTKYENDVSVIRFVKNTDRDF